MFIPHSKAHDILEISFVAADGCTQSSCCCHMLRVVQPPPHQPNTTLHPIPSGPIGCRNWRQGVAHAVEKYTIGTTF